MMKKRTSTEDTIRGKEDATMTTGRLARWMITLAMSAIFVAGGAQWALSSAVQEDPERGPGFFGPRMRGQGRGGFMHFRMARQLGLTEEQKTQLRELRKQHFDQTQVEREAHMKARKAFREAVEKNDEALIRDAARIMADAEADLALARRGHREELLQILTPAQQQKMEELRSEMEAFRKERIERRKEFRRKIQEEGPPNESQPL
jgi:protein CpxP